MLNLHRWNLDLTKHKLLNRPVQQHFQRNLLQDSLEHLSWNFLLKTLQFIILWLLWSTEFLVHCILIVRTQYTSHRFYWLKFQCQQDSYSHHFYQYRNCQKLWLNFLKCQTRFVSKFKTQHEIYVRIASVHEYDSKVKNSQVLIYQSNSNSLPVSVQTFPKNHLVHTRSQPQFSP